jgi:3-methylcrotonyl-CoA carboxylase alpha subunit
MFHTILIANRGEIACRVIRTARRMGIRTVAVYSEADAGALHTTLADAAVPIGPAAARESYLNIPAIIDAARRSGAQAIHPGYGFLSENAAFADACAAAGIVFIGPPASAIRAMGSKSAAKAAMEKAGVPLVPGYHGADQDPALLAAEAGRIGYPVLIKASAGGGGKGMRIVTEPSGFAEGLALAKGEALSAFGDDQVLVERYLTRPRHIEIQVFADRAGQTISLFERDCSIQRRHQKVVEEAPAPGMTAERRAAMGRAACAAARAIGYVGAGTVEFIVDAGNAGGEDDDFFFMEMNTRLQVEHPVTEMITGLDLVEWQLRVAAGGALPVTEPSLRGHAIEVRVYAEDPDRDFMPATGRLLHLRAPEAGPHVRVDTGVRQGDAVTVHYDPMIAKLIVWELTREAAVQRLRVALAEYEAVGVQTNLGLLRRIAAHPDFAAGHLDTGFIGRYEAALLPAAEAAPAVALAAGAAHVADRSVPTAAGDPFSPWSTGAAWRMNAAGYRDVVLRDGEAEHSIRVMRASDGTVQLSGPGVTGTARGGAVVVDSVASSPAVIDAGDALTVIIEGRNWPLTIVDPLAPPVAGIDGSGRVVAPMPGRVIAVEVVPGQAVTRGQVLLVLEAMKVQMRLTAPRDGVVAAVNAVSGELVDDGAELVVYAE